MTQHSNENLDILSQEYSYLRGEVEMASLWYQASVLLLVIEPHQNVLVSVYRLLASNKILGNRFRLAMKIFTLRLNFFSHAT